MKNNNPQDNLDLRLAKMLELLRDTPERDPELEKQIKSKFLTALDSLPLPSKRPSIFTRFLMGLGILPNNQTNKENFIMMSNKKRVAVTVVAIVVVVAIVFFGGSTATVLAAQNSIPGDTLYSVKTSFENTRLSLTNNAARRVELQLQFAEERLEEIQSLIDEGRLQSIEPAALAFDTHINSALQEIEGIAENDPALAASLMIQITESLSRYASLLSEISNYIPDQLLSEIMNMIEGAGVPDGNDNDNLNMNENDNLNMNENDNLNMNENDNLNMNENDNLNLNENYNLNLNENMNFNENDNSNDYNDNQNTDYNDNQNVDYNDNQNWNSNNNDNFNLNSNDND